jgi:xanthine dehydrogenase YagT iron-sulfur-binding subunit
MARRDADGAAPRDQRDGITRRDLLRGTGMAVAAGALAGRAGVALAEDAPADVLTQGPGAVEITLKVNGRARKVAVEPRETLLEVLRMPLDTTGAKRACDRGACGACTVTVDGATAYACTVLAVDVDGRAITTAEGLVDGGGRRLLDAFVAHDAMQCGFCTPGMAVACAAALATHGAGISKDQARAATAGNLCRCGTYPHVLDAVLAAAKGR